MREDFLRFLEANAALGICPKLLAFARVKMKAHSWYNSYHHIGVGLSLPGPELLQHGGGAAPTALAIFLLGDPTLTDWAKTVTRLRRSEELARGLKCKLG